MIAVSIRRVLPIAIAVVAIVSGAAGFAAYESHVVSITARIEERPLLESYLLSDRDPSDLSVLLPPDCAPGDPDPSIEVPAETCVWWVMRIAMSNPFDLALENVAVTDNLGAELGAVPLNDETVGVEEVTHSLGQPGEESFRTQVGIAWCVTGDLLPDGTCSGGQLEPGESTYLDLLVYTKTNASDEQEYTEAGAHEMNSGATAKWVDPDGLQCGPLSHCPTTPSLEVEVLPAEKSDTDDAEPSETPTPEPTMSPEPTETPTPEPTEPPEPVETPTPEATASPEPIETPTPEPTEPPEPVETPTPEPTEPAEPTETPTPEPTQSSESEEVETMPGPLNGQPELSGIMIR